VPIENLTGRVTWDDLRFPAAGVNPVGGGSDPAIDTADPWMGTKLFSASATNIIAGFAQMPHDWAEGSTIQPHLHWAPTNTDTGNVLWRLSYQIANPWASGTVFAKQTFPAALTTSNVLVASSGVIGRHTIAAFTDITMAGYLISAGIVWKVERLGADGTDSYTGTARLFEFDIHYQRDSYGSRQAYIK